MTKVFRFQKCFNSGDSPASTDGIEDYPFALVLELRGVDFIMCSGPAVKEIEGGELTGGQGQ